MTSLCEKIETSTLKPSKEIAILIEIVSYSQGVYERLSGKHNLHLTRFRYLLIKFSAGFISKFSFTIDMGI